MSITKEYGWWIKKVYMEKAGGDPEELIRFWKEGDTYYVLKNDDTRTALQKEDIEKRREDHIAEALKNFRPID